MKNSFYIKIIATLSVIVAVFFAAQYFFYKEIKNKNEKISEQKQEIEFQDRSKSYLVSVQKMLESISSDIEDINRSIVPQGGEVAFIENIESLAKENGLEVNISSLVLNDNPALNPANVTEFRLSIRTSGSWSGTYTFLREIESLPVKIKIERFKLSSSLQEDALNSKKQVSVWGGDFSLVVLKYK